MKNKITQFFLATLVALPVFGNEHDYSFTEYTQSAYHLDLTGANFEGAQIGGSRDFVGSNLTDANLRDANFSKVNLALANLTGANLKGTDFTDARFDTDTKWPEGFDPLTIGAHGPGVDYSGSEFTVGAYHLDLTGANFEGAQIGGAREFVGSNLTEANLENANFSKVRLNNARLNRANLKGADLREIQYNSNTDWTGAIYSVHTQWPEGFDPQAAGAVLVEENQYADLEYAKFSDELVFTQDQLNILRNVGYKWGEELVSQGAMDQDTDGFHDIYGWAKPFEISENEETGIRELFWDNKEDKSTRYRRIFWKTKTPLQVGDILLARYSYLDGMVKENVENGGGAWLSKKEINRGTLSDEQSEGISGDLPYKHRFMLFQITGLNERFPDRIHLHFNGSVAPEGIRLAQWSVRKLIMGDSDGDGVNDAEEILVSGENPLKNLPTLDAPDKNPISNRTDYRKEWEKSRLKLDE